MSHTDELGVRGTDGHRANWWLRLSVAVFLCTSSTMACRTDSNVASRGGAPSDAIETGSPAWFIDATEETGLDFTHVNGMTGEFYYPEIIAPGVALFDYD
ncbi:MAG: hypothetical protein EHM89_17390, partial [Acidobacteria bacterium]